MKQTIVSIYTLVVCGIATIALTGYAGSAIFQTIKYSTPVSFLDSGETIRLSSNDLFWQSLEEGRSALVAKGRPSENELTTRRNARLNAAILDIKTTSFSEMIQNFILACSFLVIGLVHLGIYRRISRSA